MTESPVVVAGALGECVHVAGVMNFLRLAEAAGWQTVFLGPAVSVEQVLAAARASRRDLVGVSYRLTPETGERLLAEFAEAADDLRRGRRALRVRRHAAGGRARPRHRLLRAGLRRLASRPRMCWPICAASRAPPPEADYPQTTVERIAWKAPYPLIRHHFGLPTMEATLRRHRADRRRARAGRDLAGHRPGRAGELLPPRAPGPAAHGRGRRAGAQRRRLSLALRRLAAAATTR